MNPRAIRHGTRSTNGSWLLQLRSYSPQPWQTRREFLTTSTTGALALLLAGLPHGWVGGAYAGDGPETPKVRIGIIALTDCSSIVMAHELGLFKKYGIESTISKEASWAVIRDRLTSARTRRPTCSSACRTPRPWGSWARR